jgi:hypothetical protein
MCSIDLADPRIQNRHTNAFEDSLAFHRQRHHHENIREQSHVEVNLGPLGNNRDYGARWQPSKSRNDPVAAIAGRFTATLLRGAE